MRNDPGVPSGPTQPSGGPGTSGDQARLSEIQRARQARVAKVVVALVILGILIAFIAANSQSVVVHFVFFTRRPALIWVMFACAVLGGIVGYLIGRPGRQVRLRRRPEQPRR